MEIGNLPAYQALEAAFLSIPAEQRVSVRNNLFLGLAVSEYIEDYKQGDFLIRNILGADPQNGALAVGAHPRVGQTVQFPPGKTSSWLQKTSKQGCQGRLGSCCFRARAGEKDFSEDRATTQRRWPTSWGRFLWPDSSVTER
jgi:hypothetical protein